MSISLKLLEKELNISKDEILKKGIIHYIESEIRNISIEISKIHSLYGVTSFDALLEKIEKGEISESDCFDDLTRLEYLEIEKEKREKFFQKALE